MDPLYSQIGEYKADNLIASHQVPIIVKGITLAKGQGILKRGTVLGLVTANSLAKAVDKSGADGSQNPYCILTDDVNTDQAADVRATGYVSGIFNGIALLFGGTDTLADHKASLEAKFTIAENVEY